MARKINNRSEQNSHEEITKSENIVEKEPISVELKAEMPEFDNSVDESAELSSNELSQAPEENKEEKIIVTVNEEEVKNINEKFGIDAKEEIEKIFAEKEVEVTILPKQPKSLAGLSRSQLRIFERTGRLPN
jgi:hypothetical protein